MTVASSLGLGSSPSSSRAHRASPATSRSPSIAHASEYSTS